MFKKIFIVTVVALTIDFFYGDKATDIILNLFKAAFHPNTATKSEKLFSKHELSLFNGIDKPHLYLSILGNVFDVTKGVKHYGPNQQYNVFVGKDASRSFVTGDFKDDIKEEVEDFNHAELRSLNHWLNFYNKEYEKIGLLIGKYFDENGQSTPYGKTVKRLIIEAERAKDEADLEKAKFPPCNVEWDATKGTRVWCSEKSGGVERSWIGVPRQLYEPGSKSYRCACINENNETLGVIKPYEGCPANSVSCFVKET